MSLNITLQYIITRQTFLSIRLSVTQHWRRCRTCRLIIKTICSLCTVYWRRLRDSFLVRKSHLASLTTRKQNYTRFPIKTKRRPWKGCAYGSLHVGYEKKRKFADSVFCTYRTRPFD